ncbi:MAG: hypothetical protein AABZ15_12425 [Nitrospirota bacterium]
MDTIATLFNKHFGDVWLIPPLICFLIALFLQGIQGIMYLVRALGEGSNLRAVYSFDGIGLNSIEKKLNIASIALGWAGIIGVVLVKFC